MSVLHAQSSSRSVMRRAYSSLFVLLILASLIFSVVGANPAAEEDELVKRKSLVDARSHSRIRNSRGHRGFRSFQSNSTVGIRRSCRAPATSSHPATSSKPASAPKATTPAKPPASSPKPPSSVNVESSSCSGANSHSYTLKDDYDGSGFFNKFTFTSGPDIHGTVDYVTQSEANSAHLTYVQNGVAVMRMDNSSSLGVGTNRKSVRIQSKNTYGIGNLIILDLENMPNGCSIWPAFWTTATRKRNPTGGEIDIIEAVNDDTNNFMTVHSSPGCSITQGSGMYTGKVTSTNCGPPGGEGPGCTFQDSEATSFGAGFNSHGGGVFAVQIASSGISIYRFARNAVPCDITAGNPNPSGWGVPRAFWSPKNCGPISKFFDNSQMLIFDMTTCGHWAGTDYSQGSCPGSCAQAVANPRNFDHAYWAIKSLKVYAEA